MRRKSFIILTLAFAMLSLSNVPMFADPVPVHFDVGIIDPTSDQDEPQRTPVTVPYVEIEDNTLTFVTNCDGMELSLVNEDDEVVFTTIISSSTLVLPTYLSGSYQLQIISNNYLFYGDITL